MLMGMEGEMNLEAFKWGAIFAIVCTAVVIVGLAAGVETSSSPLVSDPYRAAGAGFLWGILMYNVREWLISHRLGR